MTAGALISESDWLRLRAALRRMDEISLERSLGAVRVQDLAKSDWYMQKYRELSPRKEPYD